LPDAQRDKKAFLVKVRLIDPPAGLRSGMTAEVNIIAAEKRGVLVAPTEALRTGAGGALTAWVVRDGRAAEVVVRRGIGDVLRSEIVEGLAEGDLVVTEGADGLVEGARVRPTVRRADREQPLPSTDEVVRTSL
jgi:multidrug efflux pump subunit AcrA (membrane-fusion protein)